MVELELVLGVFEDPLHELMVFADGDFVTVDAEGGEFDGFSVGEGVGAGGDLDFVDDGFSSEEDVELEAGAVVEVQGADSDGGEEHGFDEGAEGGSFFCDVVEGMEVCEGSAGSDVLKDGLGLELPAAVDEFLDGLEGRFVTGLGAAEKGDELGWGGGGEDGEEGGADRG